MSLFDSISDPNEEWRDIAGFEGYYQVSNLGQVRGVHRILPNGKEIEAKILKPVGSRYLSVSLWRDNKGYNKLVHRLVAEAFIPNPDNLPEVNHKDLNILNCRVDNLEWVTPSYNHQHGVAHKPAGKSYRTQVKCLETGEIFPSISAAGRSVQADATQIVESIEAKRCCKGKTFVYADKLPEDELAYMQEAQSKYQSFHRRHKMKNARKVKALETGDVFDSIAAAARFYKCDTTTISNRIKASKQFNGVTLVLLEEGQA